MKNNYETIVVGAGPAGLIAAIIAKKANGYVCVLEKGEKAGRKLLLSGSGQCNITHSEDVKNFIKHYGENQANFIKKALLNFSNQDLIDFFRKRGISFITDKNGKVFPESLNSYDILNGLLKEVKQKKINIFYDHKVNFINVVDDLFKIKVNQRSFYSKKLIIATGGYTIPKTGSEGDGYSFAKKMGHKVIEVGPALTPIYPQNYRCQKLSGISIKKATIHLFRDGKKKVSYVGDVLFTHKGLSGPGILDFSRNLRKGDEIKISLVEVINEEIFKLKVLKIKENSPKKNIKHLFSALEMPAKLGEVLLNEMNISHKLQCAHISKKIITQIIDKILFFPFKIAKLGGVNEGMATRGGVDLKEINAKTMQSKLVSNLYFVGEILNIDGDTGGYNLQAAFSTGMAAGLNIKNK